MSDQPNKPIYADEVYRFLSHLYARMQETGHQELASKLDIAMKHYVFPLTSEFLGVSMTAMEDVVTVAGAALAPVDVDRAKRYAELIRRQFFGGA